MRFHLHINQAQAIELGIKNVQEAHIFDLLSICSVWAEPIVIDNEVYYWASRTTITEELPLLDLKMDSIYRYLKSLATKGLIDYKKDGKKDCIKITKLGKKYHSSTMSENFPNHYVGKKSENEEKLGKKSEKNSENFPTYHITKNIIEEKREEMENFLDHMCNQQGVKNKLAYRSKLMRNFVKNDEQTLQSFDLFMKQKKLSSTTLEETENLTKLRILQNFMKSHNKKSFSELSKELDKGIHSDIINNDLLMIIEQLGGLSTVFSNLQDDKYLDYYLLLLDKKVA